MNARVRRLEATRAEIIRAFLDLAHQGNAVSISVPAVADAAGVSVRTVYRHFPTKDALQTEASKAWGSRVRDESTGGNVTASNFSDFLHQLWKEFDADPAAVVAEHATPLGRQLRRDRLELSREMARQALASALGTTDFDDELIDTAVAMTSSSMYLELVDRMGYDPSRAANIAARAVLLMVSGFQHDNDS